MDPVRGGVFQYSVGGSWDEPHFEKIMLMQAQNLRIHAQAYAQWGDPACLETARSIRRRLCGCENWKRPSSREYRPEFDRWISARG